MYAWDYSQALLPGDADWFSDEGIVHRVEERLARMLKEAEAAFLEDPLIQNDFFIGNGMLTIAFE